MDEVGELDGVADEEHAEVVADQVPVAVLGVELDREAARVARRLGGVPPAGDRGEAQGDVGALALLLKELGARVLRDGLVAPGAVGLEVAIRGGPARVHDALGDALAIDVADLLEELVVLERRRAAVADRALVLVVRDRVALAVGQRADGRQPWCLPGVVAGDPAGGGGDPAGGGGDPLGVGDHRAWGAVARARRGSALLHGDGQHGSSYQVRNPELAHRPRELGPTPPLHRPGPSRGCGEQANSPPSPGLD